MDTTKRDHVRIIMLDCISQHTEATEAVLLEVYLTHYPLGRQHRHKSRDRLAAFMGSMESDGLVTCSYSERGQVISAKARP